MEMKWKVLYLNQIEMNKFMIPVTFEAITSFSKDDKFLHHL